MHDIKNHKLMISLAILNTLNSNYWNIESFDRFLRSDVRESINYDDEVLAHYACICGKSLRNHSSSNI